ncbi:MAG: Streptopain precursor [Bacteroidetes bacterium ADurb.Bin408]|nr:MAG: Streptopain precursor [Bacteroidetes bacterium ADurb.Bin408]
MKKITPLLIFLLLCFINVVVIAQTINQDKALQAALKFYTQRYNALSTHVEKAVFSAQDFKLQQTQKNDNGDVLYYIFDMIKGGYIIVSANEKVYPVLGYAFDNEFPYPVKSPAVKGWLMHYENQINDIISNTAEASAENKSAWSELLSAEQISPKGMKDVVPLLLTTWDQGKFYNEMCPVDANGDGGHVYAGCVATSMAQVMKYYNYPVTGSGSNSYNSPPYGTQSANFGTTTYRWNEMPLSVTSSNSAVALLLYHCGVAVDMSYGTDGSSASTTTAATALKNNFKYASSASYKSKYTYTTTNWNNLLKGNLDIGRPMIYSGSPTSGAGHAWNCDGYQGTDYFHMNWGWSGYYNGYFYLNALTAGGDDFSYFQGAVVDIYPGQNYPYNCSGTKTLTAIAGTFDDGSGPSNYQNNSDCSWLIDPTIPVAKIKISFDLLNTESSNDLVTIYDGENTSAPVLGTYSGTTLPSLITSNTGKVLVRFTTNGSGTAAGWHISYSSTFPNYCSNLTNLTAIADTFSDGSGSNNYNPVTSCRWRIMPTGATAITLTFTEFNLPNPSDLVEVYDVSSGNVLLDQYTGTTIPAEYVYNASKIMVWFKSNTQTPGAGFRASYTATISGIDQLNDIANFNLYPNPADNYIAVDVEKIQHGSVLLSLYNSAGSKVYDSHLQAVEGHNTFLIPAGTLSNGIYFLNMTTDKSIMNRKIVVQH